MPNDVCIIIAKQQDRSMKNHMIDSWNSNGVTNTTQAKKHKKPQRKNRNNAVKKHKTHTAKKQQHTIDNATANSKTNRHKPQPCPSIAGGTKENVGFKKQIEFTSQSDPEKLLNKTIEGFSLVGFVHAQRGGNAVNRQNIRLCMRAHHKRDIFSKTIVPL